MSLLNGKLPRRMAVALGSACFLGGLTLAAAPADAGLYVSIRVDPASLPAGVTQSGNVFTGYTITAPSGTTTPLNLQIVAAITSGASTSAAAANPALQTIRGAIRTVASTNGSFTATSGVSFVTGSGSQTFRNTSTLPGTFGAGGIGPQSGTFGSSDSTTSSDRDRFESLFAATTSTIADGVAVPDGFNISTTETVVGGFTGSVTGTGSLQLQAVGGGTDAASALAQYYENRNPGNLSGTLLFSNITSNAATINFGSTGPTLVRGDLGGNSTPLGIDPSLDGTTLVPDGAVTGADIDAYLLFNAALDVYGVINPSYAGLTAAQLALIGDFGGNPTPLGIDPSLDGTTFVPDGVITGADIDAYLLFNAAPDVYQLIQDTAGGSSLRVGVTGAVPEPTAAALLLPVALLAGRRRR